MAKIRFASINGEWMNSWFTADGIPAAFLPSFKLPGESTSNSTAKTAKKLAAEIKAINADILMLQEAPSRKEELTLFIADYLSTPGGPVYNSILGAVNAGHFLAVEHHDDPAASGLDLVGIPLPDPIRGQL